jgi:tripartite-type tricarboxylate transporter receptor subunit TctC
MQKKTRRERTIVRMAARRTMAALSAALLAGLAMHSPTQAQGFPERNITLIVPFAAGGASDVSSRIMADAMSKHLNNQTIVVENVAGAGGATGSLRGKNARPDGYTIGFGHMGTHSASVAVNPKLPYDPRTDYDYLGIHLVTPNIMIVRKDLPVNNLQEFIAYAKEKGKDLKMGHNGVGSLSHLTCVVFFQLIGVEPTYVVFRGFGQTINDILSGAIDGTCELVASVTGHVKGGSVKGFGVAADERSPVLPDIPTSTEGGLPGFKVESWLGLYAPKGLPPEVLAKLREAAVKSLDDPVVQKKFLDIGGSVPKPERRGGDHMLATIKTDVDRWIDVVKKAGGIQIKE